MHALGLEFGSAAQLSIRPGIVWNCLWGYALKRSPGIIRKGRTIQLVIIAIQSSLYWNEKSFGYIACKMRCYLLETPWTYQKVYKTGVGTNKNIEMKWVQQFSNELNDPHGPPHCLGAHVNNHWTVNYDIHVYDTSFLEAILKIKIVSRPHSR